MIGITLLEQVGPAFKCIYQNYYYRDEHDDDDDTAIKLSAMFFRIRTTAAYQEVGGGMGWMTIKYMARMPDFPDKITCLEQ